MEKGSGYPARQGGGVGGYDSEAWGKGTRLGKGVWKVEEKAGKGQGQGDREGEEKEKVKVK